MSTDAINQLASGILATLAAIILHELAHGLAALAMGDNTAKAAGRLSLNPLKHVDRIGTVLLPGILIISQLATIGRIAFLFGWAKPVPINPAALSLNGHHNSRRLMAVVAAAGPAMNFLLAYLGALALYGGQALAFLVYFIEINLALGLFNLIPLPPLDGGRIAVGLLPLPAARLLARLEGKGLLLVMFGLVFIPALLPAFGLHFNPLQSALNTALPWATDTVMHLAGHINDPGNGF